jgi:carbonic anhydrase
MNIPSVRSDEELFENLIDIKSATDIPEEWRDSPIEAFIMSQNSGWPIQTSGKPELLISTCIEFRYALPMPRMYAYVIRRASGRVIGSEFSVAYTLAKGVKHLILIGHNDCGMSAVAENTPNIIASLVDQGWSRPIAEEYVQRQGARHAMGDELEALKIEYRRLRKVFPKLTIAPLFVCLYDNKLYVPKWYKEVQEEFAAAPPITSVSDETVRNLP